MKQNSRQNAWEFGLWRQAVGQRIAQASERLAAKAPETQYSTVPSQGRIVEGSETKSLDRATASLKSGAPRISCVQIPRTSTDGKQLSLTKAWSWDKLPVQAAVKNSGDTSETSEAAGQLCKGDGHVSTMPVNLTIREHSEHIAFAQQRQQESD